MICVARICSGPGLCLKHSDTFTVLLWVIQWWKDREIIIMILFCLFFSLFIYSFGSGWFDLCLKLKVVDYRLLKHLILFPVKWAFQLINDYLNIIEAYLANRLLIYIWCTLSLSGDQAWLSNRWDMLNTICLYNWGLYILLLFSFPIEARWDNLLEGYGRRITI